MNFSSEISNNILFINLSGDLIGENSGLDLVEKASEALNQKVLKCLIDISEVRYINSSGIGVLITLLTKFRNKGGEMVLVSPSESVSKLLIITKLNAIFTMANSKEEAQQHLA
jgi:anti-sigma B factor antagonist